MAEWAVAEIEKRSCPGCGSCSGMFTANSMNSLTEAIGLSLPGNGTVLATSMFFITLGGVAQFVQYSRKFAGPINEFSNILHEFQSAFSAAERVFTILDEEPEKAYSSDAKELTEVLGDVSFKDVTFGYTEDKIILKNVFVNVSMFSPSHLSNS